jgi:hypothetical protein
LYYRLWGEWDVEEWKNNMLNIIAGCSSIAVVKLENVSEHKMIEYKCNNR